MNVNVKDDGDIDEFGKGWAVCKGGGPTTWIPTPDATEEARREWMLGYCAALADINPLGECVSIEESLRADKINGAALAALLDAGEAIEKNKGKGAEFVRWPSIPLRQRKNRLKQRRAWQEEDEDKD